MIRTLVIAFFLLTSSLGSFASHIVGGEIYYELINPNANQYRITVNIYFDCVNGRPDAISSDNTINIGVYDAKTNAYKSYFSITYNDKDRLNEVPYSCVVDPGNVCVDGYEYSRVVTLDPGDNGIILSWQRCCRNKTISNILNAEDMGITMWTKIPPSNISKQQCPVQKTTAKLCLCKCTIGY